MSGTAVLDRLRAVRCFLLDMDGTMTLGESALPGAHRFLDGLDGRDYLFLTNNSSHSADHYLKRLSRLGMPVSRRQVVTSTDALIILLHQLRPGTGPTVYPVGTPGFEEDLRAGGIILEKERGRPIDFVVLGFDTTLVYEKLDIACDYIRGGIPYLAANPDKVCPLAGGKVLPDCGALIEFMRTCTGRDPQRVIGKPDPSMVRFVQSRDGYAASRLAMVGDRLYTDIAAGRAAGILTVLVLSGEATAEDAAASPIQPDLIVSDVGELAELMRTPDRCAAVRLRG